MQTQTVATPKFPIKTNSLHAELKKRVKEYLDQHDIRSTGNYKLFTKAVILISLFFGYKTFGYLIYQPGPDCYQDENGRLRSLEDDELVYVINNEGEVIIKNDYDTVFLHSGGYYHYIFLDKR